MPHGAPASCLAAACAGHSHVPALAIATAAHRLPTRPPMRRLTRRRSSTSSRCARRTFSIRAATHRRAGTGGSRNARGPRLSRRPSWATSASTARRQREKRGVLSVLASNKDKDTRARLLISRERFDMTFEWVPGSRLQPACARCVAHWRRCGIKIRAHGRVRERTHGSGLLTSPQPTAIGKDSSRHRPWGLSWAAGSRLPGSPLPTCPAWQAACRP